MAGHTPGPWILDNSALSIWATNAKIGGDTKVFDVRGWGYLTGGGHGALGLSYDEAKAIQRANGFLAAAAPDLLAALEKIVLAFDCLPPASGTRYEPFGINHARAAIAKATGQ